MRPGFSSAVRALLCISLPLAAAAAPPAITLTQVVTGFSQPVEIIAAPDGTNRLFVVQQGGRIRIANGSVINGTDFLNIPGVISTGTERGLLGLAFHPNYAANGTFYVFYTATNGALTIARYLRSAAIPDVADPLSGVPILSIPHSSQSNHNGGHIAFGPDGHLYIGTAD